MYQEPVLTLILLLLHSGPIILVNNEQKLGLTFNIQG